MHFPNKIKNDGAHGKVQASETKTEFIKEVKTHLGSVVNLTALKKSYTDSKKRYKEAVQESPNILVRHYWDLIEFISTIDSTVVFYLTKIQDDMKNIDFKNEIAGLKLFGNVISIFNLYSLKSLFKEIKNYPQQLREAEKTNQVARAVLSGIGLLSKIVKLPVTIIESIAPLTNLIRIINLEEIVKLSNWAPSLGAVSLVLSTALTSLKIWDLYDTYKFADKMKEKCCLELIRNLDEDLKNEFKENQLLLAKLDLALAFDKGKKLKKLHQKELAFQVELAKKNPDPEILLQQLEELHSTTEGTQAIIEQLKATISLYQLNQCLTYPEFKKSVLSTTAELLNKTKDEMDPMIAKGNQVNLKTLKKEIKRAAAELNPEILDRVNRSAKLTYLNILADYNPKKLTKFYQVDGKEIQGATKNTIAVVNSLMNKNQFNRADETLSIAYKELKGRVTYKTFGDKLSLLINAVGMAATSVSLAISFGALPSPAAPAGIALGVAASAAGLLLTMVNTIKTIRFKENLGIAESNLQEKLQERLQELGDTHPFYKTLSPEQVQLFNLVKKQVAEGNFNNPIHYRFAVPKVTWQSTSDERSRQKATKQMNRMIQSMNEWSVKQEIVQERTHSKFWSSQLKKINLNYLPEKSYVNLWLNLQQIVKNKNFNKIDNLKQIPINTEWDSNQKYAVEQLNNLINSIQTAEETRCQTKSVTLTNKIEMLKLKFLLDPNSKTPENEHILKECESQQELNHQRLKLLETAIENNL